MHKLPVTAAAAAPRTAGDELCLGKAGRAGACSKLQHEEEVVAGACSELRGPARGRSGGRAAGRERRALAFADLDAAQRTVGDELCWARQGEQQEEEVR